MEWTNIVSVGGVKDREHMKREKERKESDRWEKRRGERIREGWREKRGTQGREKVFSGNPLPGGQDHLYG